MATPQTQPRLPLAPFEPAGEGLGTSLFDQLSDIVTAYDRDGRFLYVNPAGQRSFDRPVVELLGRVMWELYPDSIGNPFHQAFLRVVATGEPQQFDHFYPPWARWFTNRMYWAENRLWVIGSDITERKNAEAENARLFEAEREAKTQAERIAKQTSLLQSTMERLSLALSRTLVAEAIVDTAVDVVCSVNGGIWLVEAETKRLRLLHSRGYPADTTSFESFDIAAPTAICTAARTGEAVWLENWADYARRFPVSESKVRGAKPAREGSFACLPLMFEGIAVGVLALSFDGPHAFDESERRFLGILAQYCAQALERARLFENERNARAAAEAREQQVKVQAWIVERMSEGVTLADANGTIIYTNPAQSQILGYGADELVGLRVTVQLGNSVEENEGLFGKVVEHVNQKGAWKGIVDARRKDGTGFVSRAHVSHLELGGKPHFVCVQSDITEEQRHEEFERHVIGIVSHDLRNPISAITVSAGLMLQRGGLDEQQTKTARRIVSAAERTHRLIRDFLDFAQIRGGVGMRVVRAPVDLHELTRVTVEEVQLSHPGRVAKVESAGDGVGNFDRDRIAQVIGNLVGNAFEHGKSDGPIWVRSTGDAAQVRVEIHNHGKPIPDVQLPTLFEPFKRGSESSPHSSGLGLYITRQLILAHGGTIEVSSSAEGGTAFVIKLPRSSSL